MVPARSSRHGLSCSRHLSRSQAETPLIPAVQISRYITSQFEVRFSATIYLVCFCFFKQLAMIFMSILAGNMYESIGFQGAYLVLGLVALGFTLISVFTLSGPDPLSLLRRQVNEVA
ncbi:MFS transporter [Klebsiella pneumoniae]|uniref:MFS transporter n=1 Tax=Klebsiella pneumoniae TaxID=573 RepID=UPI00295E2525|nr:MFS transporter [Klebsiella pneumoniae]WOV09809.1 MFS transporter [Klebsiella pneumoniae]